MVPRWIPCGLTRACFEGLKLQIFGTSMLGYDKLSIQNSNYCKLDQFPLTILYISWHVKWSLWEWAMKGVYIIVILAQNKTRNPRRSHGVHRVPMLVEHGNTIGVLIMTMAYNIYTRLRFCFITFSMSSNGVHVSRNIIMSKEPKVKRQLLSMFSSFHVGLWVQSSWKLTWGHENTKV